MSVEGRISVDVVFHDTDGTNAINVVSLQKSDAYPSGIVQYLSGTAGTAAFTFGEGGFQGVGGTTYRNAAGQEVSSNARRIAFSWSGGAGDIRDLSEVESGAFLLRSVNGEVAVSSNGGNAALSMSACSTTGTYTLVVYGDS
jgi:hypothetical protein